MNTERKDLLEEANNLGLEFHSNISSVKLKERIAEFKGEPLPVEETAPASPAVKAKEPKEEPGLTKLTAQRKMVSDAKKAAYRKQIVTITNKDNRENDVMTTAYVGFENQHFGLSRIVPLDIAIELETALIKILAATTMTHKEIVDGKRTGNKVPVRVKKYAISYSRKQPE